MSDSLSTVSNSPPASPPRQTAVAGVSNGESHSSPNKPSDQQSVQSTTETEMTVSRTLKFAGTPDEDAPPALAPPPIASTNNNEILTVEFVPPTEGTPAALALAANAQIKVSKLDRVTHKFRSLKRPKMKSLNILKKLNKTTKTKKRRKKRHFSKNFKGKVIDGLHELYTLTAGMMLGIRYCVGRSHSDKLKEEDFGEVENVVFPPKGNTVPPMITPPHSLAHTFKFKSYSPKVFHKIREFYDIDPKSYMMSVCGDYNFLEFISNSKSGQFFFYSHDGKYMLKTQTKEENKFLKRILPQYYDYIKENPHSLLVRILGMHRIKMYHLRRKVHFVIMASVFDTPAQINTIYDLKGSMIGRSATQRERENGGVLKDCDLVDDHRKFHLGKKRKPFLAQLKKDAKFLASLNIMDYSLLVGIHDRDGRVKYGKIEHASLLHSTDVENTTAANTAANENIGSSSISNLSSPLQTHSGTIVHSPAPTTSISTNVEGGVVGLSSVSGDGMNQPIHPHQQHVHAHVQTNTRSNTPFRRANNGNTAATTTLQSESTDFNALTPGQQLASLSEGAEDNKIRVSKKKSGTRKDLTGKNTGGKTVNSSSTNIIRDRDNMNNHVTNNNTTSSDVNVSVDEIDVSVHSSVPSVTHQAATSTQPVLQSDVSDSEYENEQAEGSEGEGEEEEEEGEEGEGEGEGEGDVDYDEEEVEYDYDEVDAGDSDADGNPPVQDLHPSNRGEHFGNGITFRAPWTWRLDGGINSHGVKGRMNEIYFVGIIDILQEYNLHKKTETVFKGLFNDVRQISSVDPVNYARRFIQFLEANTD